MKQLHFRHDTMPFLCWNSEETLNQLSQHSFQSSIRLCSS